MVIIVLLLIIIIQTNINISVCSPPDNICFTCQVDLISGFAVFFFDGSRSEGQFQDRLVYNICHLLQSSLDLVLGGKLLDRTCCVRRFYVLGILCYRRRLHLFAIYEWCVRTDTEKSMGAFDPLICRFALRN